LASAYAATWRAEARKLISRRVQRRLEENGRSTATWLDPAAHALEIRDEPTG